MSTHADSKPWTVPALAEAKRNGQKLVMLTAYDAGLPAPSMPMVST